MESEKVKEIKKALEGCNLDKDCNGCPYYDEEDCIKTKNDDILTLINGLESENERLGRENQQLKDRIAELEKESASLLNRVLKRCKAKGVYKR